MTLQAVLWDMDGTLVDSEPVWVRVQIAVLAELGATWTAEDSMTLVGSDLADALKVWMAQLPAGTIESDELAERIYGEVVRTLKEGVVLRPGALELLTGLKAAGIPCALVSASYRLMIETVLSHLPPDLFDVIVAGDEVRNGKPHPEPYLTAAAELGVDPADCVVIEDSPGGTRSGTAAGAFVVAVPQWVTIPEAPRRLVLESLESLSPDALRDLLR
ncbi:HAD family phosphatase [Streptomyces sp. SID13031]|uniref:HAD family hydrolase n=1 Tax=Streptomyces sp. SID13031 TaxID=2706046 RepID=UPI0013CB0C0D|nr:HAD family phosphatase [Streptomyces sp. SID13031]NEA30788.1 HAD family phosphatase [Streptomyces sp. SID13031]